MGPIALLLTLLILLINLAGIAQCFERRFGGDTDLARAAGVLLLCLVLFFVEHFTGLGKLAWVWPVGTALSVLVLNRRLLDTAWWDKQQPFVLAFLFVLAWRYAFPDIDAQSEHLTDLYFVANYLGGDTLPPPDQWLPGYRFDMYYGFLHYATALQGRILNLDAGRAMNLGFCTTFAFTASLAWSLTGRFLKRAGARLLVVAALTVGGTGVAPLIPLIYDLPAQTSAQSDANAVTRLWTNTRFAGLYDQQVNTPVGRALFPALAPEDKPLPDFQPRELPLETLSYYTYLGDLHPPVGGFALLLFVLALIGAVEAPIRLSAPAAGEDSAEPSGWRAETGVFLLGLSLPLLLALNPWTLPLQALLVLGWCAWRWRSGQAPHWLALVMGGVVGGALIYPFMLHFAPNAVPTHIALVDALDHTPVRQFLGLWWPVLMLAALALAGGPRARLGWWAGWTVLLLLAVTEILFVDDPLTDRYNRFNTTLKWWSWLYPAGIALLGTLTLASSRRVIRILACVPLLATCLYLIPQAQYWVYHPRPHAGRLAGDGWLNDDPGQRAILNYLRSAPKGLVLEGLDNGSYSPHGAFALHSGQPSALGWPDHEGLWRDHPWFINRDADFIRALYHGSLPDAGQWLAGRNVRYIVWSSFDQQRDATAFARMQDLLASRYIWHPLNDTPNDPRGLWELRR
ncbi:hypothetical protein HNQ50_003995 [Silvimonas terrae]|uniref:Chlor_Arch_YYY domain-containing protein n=1 Tax=Silvimonas terrae TaxID=300266 RepID=A0A840RMB7_9NEIS|nr:DUF2298 domain-containing protein [Silvimonas terrae]MBB5193241.1 hypothetical protein [Silvimonas terrae]